MMDIEELDGVAVEYETQGNMKVAKYYKAVETKPVIEREPEKEQTDEVEEAVDFSSLKNDVEVDLPEWNMGLSDDLLRGLHDLGFANPTEVQKSVIPDALKGNDIIAKASTGSGKTLAFALPILEASHDLEHDHPHAIIIAPTRELVLQIVNHIKAVAKYTSFSVASVTGGLAVQKQLRLLSQNPTIVVATPGRFEELIRDNSEIMDKFRMSEFLVLDEADRLLEEGHFKNLDQIFNLVRPKQGGRQTMVFSATFQKSLTKKMKRGSFHSNLAGDSDVMAYLLRRLKFQSKEPKFIDLNPNESVAKQVSESFIECTANEKNLYLYYFLLRYPGRSLIFVNSVHAVRHLVPLLKEMNLPATGIQSHMIQKQRLKSLDTFRSNKNGILVATDVAARGLDIPGVDHVVHFQLPRSADIYVHRSGRTGRGEASEGLSLILCAPEELSGFKSLMKHLHKSSSDIKSFPNIQHRAAAQLSDRVRIAKRITDAVLANGQSESAKKSSKNSWLKKAAEDLGIEDEELEKVSIDKKTAKQQLPPAQIKRLRGELQQLLKMPINESAQSMNFITAGRENLAQRLVEGTAHSTFLGASTSTALRDLRK
ncbi:hypothetical protein CANCADRAFT_30893 [Tortispora caseinolytica NRRL Y-17796]|uniref:RNA helicase n=1 Tax=Tortispora caseinolytica NRRL Y-17796 TaxID=767744 RepID=A0A1E4TMA2_9ASCO|nr:hypothetical protein CANCADRAFT_30893 [Tortispora caseinolytica NRRL Y-17796]